MATDSAIRVEGLKQLQRAFAVAGKEFSKDLRSALESAAEPVRSQAASSALTQISGMRRQRVPWNEMRVGVTRGSVYVAPKQRSTRIGSRKRRNIAGRLMDEAMQPALDANRGKVEGEVIDAITDMTKAWARVG